MSRRLAFGAAGLTLLVAGLSGCSIATHQDSGNKEINHEPAKVTLEFPDGFRNVAFKCNGTTGVYVTSAGADDTLPSGVAVLANDPMCAH